MVIKCLNTWNTEFNADSVEWCPSNPFQNVLAVGTYEMDTDSGQRKGRLFLTQIAPESISILQKMDVPGILDMKWSNTTLAIVDALGRLSSFQLQEENGVLEKSTEIQICSGIALSLEWNDRALDQSHPKIVISDSLGGISVVDHRSLRVTHNWKAHDFEAWITAFNAQNPEIIYTGGDDCLFKGYDLRIDTESPIFISKLHSAGVTSIQSDVFETTRLYSGSYDENLRCWDIRNMKRTIYELNTGGGVWRIKQNKNNNRLAIACMHGGFHVVEGNEIIDSFLEHDSLAYGVDWNREDEKVGASCSFYDRTLKVWKTDF